ncbi:MAG: ferrous iron transport protein A [Cytophagales bacterium]|nr:MAG: ferrous iron transport protein A [Cytophagales bacterium]TAH28016.1 MAG: ferrous iron transport protein A [Cytophagales bacterium]
MMQNKNYISLSSLKKGEKGVIIAFDDDKVALKLLEMGCLPQTQFSLSAIAPFGCPICIEIENTQISMRLSEANHILVEKII